MLTATLSQPVTPTPTRRAGAWCLAAGVVGAAQALTVLMWSPQVADNRYSYPFTGLGFVVTQLSFFVQHVPLVIGLAALLRLPAVRASRGGRAAAGAAVIGMGLLATAELLATSAYDASTDSRLATFVNNIYGPPVLLIGFGLVATSVALLRGGDAGRDGVRRIAWVVLALGCYVFVPLTPAIMGPFTAGRVAIGGWMLLFALLGWTFTRLDAAGSTR